MAEDVIHCGDCLDWLPTLAAGAATGCVTDPPYGLRFMGREWDGAVPGAAYWREVLRVVRPGGVLLAFGGTRTWHRLAVAIEDAGWVIRDTIMWVYGSGFPKSLDISKAIDRAAGAEREVVSETRQAHYDGSIRTVPGAPMRNVYSSRMSASATHTPLTAPATDAAREWEGWGTALKPAWEPIIVAMRPVEGTFAGNALTHGVAGIHVDGGRVGITGTIDPARKGYNQAGCGLPDGVLNRSPIYEGGWGGEYYGAKKPHPDSPRHDARGRWPANVVHDGSGEVVGLFPETGGGGKPQQNLRTASPVPYTGKSRPEYMPYGDTLHGGGTAARFFYCAKASRAERGEGNRHPTVKPLALMRWLVRLVTMPRGTVILDPFCGSGSTLIAARLEGAGFLGCDLDEGACEVARRRLEERCGLPLFEGEHGPAGTGRDSQGRDNDG